MTNFDNGVENDLTIFVQLDQYYHTIFPSPIINDKNIRSPLEGILLQYNFVKLLINVNIHVAYRYT